MASSSSKFHRCGGGYANNINVNEKKQKPPWSSLNDDVAAPRRRIQKLTVSSSPAKMATTEDSIPSCPLQPDSIDSPDDNLPTILITAEDLGLDNPQEAIKKLASRPSQPKSPAQKPPSVRPKTASTLSRTRRAQSPRRNARPMTSGSRRSEGVGRGAVRRGSGYEEEGRGIGVVKPQPMTAWSVTELLDDDNDNEISEPSELDTSISSLHALTDNEPIHVAEDTVESLAGGDTLRSDDPIRKLIEGPPVDDAEYDTDLEEEFSPDKEMIYDPAGKNVYLAECKQEGSDPASYVLRHLHETIFRMRHRYLSMQALMPLAKAFKSNTCTEMLDLRDNHLEGDGGAVIAFMMRDNCYITTLDVSENQIGSAGVCALSSMLETNYTLKTLRLSANHLTDRDTLRLSEGLKNNSTLTEIDLSYNDLGESAGVHLASALDSSIVLIALSLASVRKPMKN